MKLKLQSNNLQSYLAPSDIIDFDSRIYSGIRDLADNLQSISTDKTDYIKNAYEYVRDKIDHSADINQDEVTCCSSEVLKKQHGICFAKSHLLAENFLMR